MRDVQPRALRRVADLETRMVGRVRALLDRRCKAGSQGAGILFCLDLPMKNASKKLLCGERMALDTEQEIR